MPLVVNHLYVYAVDDALPIPEDDGAIYHACPQYGHRDPPEVEREGKIRVIDCATGGVLT